MAKLAIDGGKPVRAKSMPPRGLIGRAEKRAAMKMFDDAIASGEAFGYNGPAEQQFEKDFAKMMGGGFADGVNSGTNAVFVALGALGLDAFSEVIIPPVTDPGGMMPVVFLGCVPVVADGDPRSYNTAARYIEPLITKRTGAIVVAHIGGDAVDMDPVMKLARAHGIPVVEDCAQAQGTLYKGRLAGTIGDIASFSTMFGKHVCTGGQGGVVYTRDEKLYWQAKRFADRGKPFNLPGVTGNVCAGLNCNLNELSAAIGSAQLKKLAAIVAKRRQVCEALEKGMKSFKSVSAGWQTPNSESSYWFLRVKFNARAVKVDKKRFCQALTAEGLLIRDEYWALPSKEPWFVNKAVFGKSGFPWNASDYKGNRNPTFKLDNALKAVRTHFNIRTHEGYGRREVADVLKAIEKVEKAYLR